MTDSVLEVVKIIVPIALVALGFVGGYIFEHRVLKRLKSIADRTGWQGYEIILGSLQGMTLLWFAIAGIFAATLSISLETWLEVLLQKILLALLLGSATIVISRLAVGFIQFYGGRGEDTSPLTSLFENLTKLVIFRLGILIIIQSLGISITPLLTALGILGSAKPLRLDPLQCLVAPTNLGRWDSHTAVKNGVLQKTGDWGTGVRIVMRLNTMTVGAYNLHGIQNLTRAIVLSDIRCTVFRGENFHKIG